MSNYPNWQSYSYKHSFIESFPISFYNENKNQCEDSIKMKLFDKVKDYIFDGKNYKIRCELATDRKSTRLNSSHGYISYAVFCLKKKTHRASPNPLPNDTPRPSSARPPLAA